ncbi:MAG: carboxymuconolactone decarboxylase family protein [Coxiellaceae bacterium]|nr:carboxymuconolactone decarboxylase family protein [Coxiellaceae bacterium]
MKDKKFKTGTKQGKNIEDGIKKFNSFFGEDEQIFPSFRKVSPDFADYCAGFIYGDLFLRKGIDDKTRFLAIIGSLIGQGNTGLPLRRYIYGALSAGWTKKELVEVIIILSAYAGFPSAVVALYTAEEAFAAIDAKANGKSAEI